MFLLLFQGMYFDRDDVALKNFSRFFLERSVKDREQAEKLLEYQNMRGGRVLLRTIAVNVHLFLKFTSEEMEKHLLAIKNGILTISYFFVCVCVYTLLETK